MRVHIKAAAALREFLPVGAVKGKIEMDVEEGTTPADIIHLLGIPAERRLMVILDGTMVTRPDLNVIKMKESQTLSLNPPIQAG